MKGLLSRNHLLTGILIGTLLPIPVAFIFIGLLRLMKAVLPALSYVQDKQMFLLSMAVNLLVMRYFFRQFDRENIAKGILAATFVLTVVFFVFLKNMNFTLPF